jgi:hypothetical protein
VRDDIQGAAIMDILIVEATRAIVASSCDGRYGGDQVGRCSRLDAMPTKYRIRNPKTPSISIGISKLPGRMRFSFRSVRSGWQGGVIL